MSRLKLHISEINVVGPRSLDHTHDIQGQIDTEAGREPSNSSTRDSPVRSEETPCRSGISGAVTPWTPSDAGPNRTDRETGAPAACRITSSRSTPENTYKNSHVRVEASVLSLYQCDRFCICQCHKVTNMATPNSLGKLIGRLFLGYVGVPLLSHRTCNHVSCRHGRSQMRIRIAYLFPLWFALRLIALTITKASTTFMWTLSFPVVTQTSCPMLVLTSLGSIEKIQGLLAANAVVLNAIDIIASKSPLHVGTAINTCDGEADVLWK